MGDMTILFLGFVIVVVFKRIPSHLGRIVALCAVCIVLGGLAQTDPKTSSTQDVELNREIAETKSLSQDDLDGIGGQWHAEAIQAWKIYNKGKELSLASLGDFLVHGNPAKLDRYYEIACNAGCPGFCSIPGLANMKIHPAKSAEWFNKACNIAHDLESCTSAIYGYVDSQQIGKAKEIFKQVCNENDLRCYTYADSTDATGRNFRKMLTAACGEGHSISCNILKNHAPGAQ